MKHTTILLLSLFVSFLWGIGPVIQKHILGTLHVKTMFFLYGVSYFICIAIYGVYNRHDIYDDIKKNMNMRLFLIIVLLGFLLGFLANVLYLLALRKKESYIVNALICSSPIFTLIFAYLFLKEKVDLMGFFGVMFVVIGIIMIAFNNIKSDEFYTELHE